MTRHCFLRRISPLLALMFAGYMSTPNASADLVLSGASVFSADATGAATALNIWNTNPGDSYYNIYFTGANTGTGGAFINSGNGAALPPNYTLGVGTYQFFMFADPGGASAYHGISLFMNGSNSPAISAFAATDNSAPPSHPSFSADGSSSTRGLDGSLGVPGASMLSYTSDGLTATLTDYYWANPSVYNLDRVGTFGIGSDGANDFVGSITLNVTSAVPGPSGIMMLGTGIVGLLGYTRRRIGASSRSTSADSTPIGAQSRPS